MALRQDEAYDMRVATDTVAPLTAPSRDGNVDVVRDRELVERCQAGDRAAFDELYLRYQRRLHRFCMQRVGEANDAEDVVQETFARAWRALPRFAGERRFYPWLTVIAGNLCVDTLRRRSRMTPVEESRLHASDIGTYDTEDAILQDVDSKMVAAAFSQLSERHRRVLQLREGNDWSYKEIAEHEGVGITAVETLLWRARQALKREFLLLDGQKGKLGTLAGFLTVLRVRVLGMLVRIARQPCASLRHAVRHLTSGFERAFGTGGAFGIFGPSAAAATGAVVLGMGTMLLAPMSPVAPAPVLPASVPSVAGTPLPGSGASTPPRRQAPVTTPVTGSGAGPGGGTPVPTSSTSAAASSGGSGGAAGGGTPVTVPATPAAGLGSAVGGLGSTLGGAAGGVGSTVTGAAGGLGSTVGGAAGSVGSTVTGAVGGLSSTVGGAAAGLGSSVAGATGGLSSTVNGTVGGLGSTAGGLTGALGLPALTGAGGAPGTGTSAPTASGSGLLGLGG